MDNPELTDEERSRLRLARKVFAPALYEALTRRGRPKAVTKRVQLTLPGGPGWQTRMNAALAADVARVKKAPERA